MGTNAPTPAPGAGNDPVSDWRDQAWNLDFGQGYGVTFEFKVATLTAGWTRWNLPPDFSEQHMRTLMDFLKFIVRDSERLWKALPHLSTGQVMTTLNNWAKATGVTP